MTAANRPDLKALDQAELELFMDSIGEPRYRGRQLFKWMYGKGVQDFESMTNLPTALRSRLTESAEMKGLHEESSYESTDGTVKTLFRLSSGHAVETVLIPDFDEYKKPKRLTVCVSSQVGCAMDCSFCATGQMGFIQSLSSGEIFDQVFATNKKSISRYGKPVSNIVYMGMGEPLLNYDAVRGSISKITDANGLGMSGRRITVSTVGLAGQIQRMADDNLSCNLAVSLHAPTDEKRSAIMPVNRKEKTDLSALRKALVYYARVTGRSVTYEYCLFKEFNDTMDDATQLVDICRWIPSKINLIMYNPVEGVSFVRSEESTVNRFVRCLIDGGITVTVRRSRGQDINAACGQLAIHAQQR